MKYKSPSALEMAVKEAAKASPLDTSLAVRNFYYHRLLCRVFSEENPSFVLKGGLGMLARTIDARATRDADLATYTLNIDEAVEELRRLAAKDLGDFVSFQYESMEPVRAEDEYREGYKVGFTAYMGTRAIQKISVDLVADAIPCETPDFIRPADRIEIDGLETYDYPVYPVTRAIADKVAGIIETHDGRPSSRVKDLIDLIVYLRTESFGLSDLRSALERELALRHLEIGDSFSVPASWRQSYRQTYAKLAEKTRLPEELHDLETAESLVSSCLEPVLAHADTESVWDCKSLSWKV